MPNDLSPTPSALSAMVLPTWMRAWTVLWTTAALILASVSLLIVGNATPAAAETNAANGLVRGQQTWYIYVAPGELPYANFAKATIEAGNAWGPDTVIEVRDPSNAIAYSCTVTSATPINTAAPVCTYAPTTAVSGTWSVSIIRPASADTTKNLGRNVFNWRIGAVDASNVQKPGRVWTEQYVMRDAGLDKPVDLTLYYQTDQGFTYQIDRRKMTGVDSTFNGDALGVVNSDTCASAYLSVTFPDLIVTPPGENPVPYRTAGESGCDYTSFKIFFDPPAADLPTATVLPDGTSTWLLTSPPSDSDINVENFEFTPLVAGSRSGRIDFGITRFEGTVDLQVDANNDGQFDGPLDRTMNVAVTKGLASHDFDGLDGAGNAIATTTPLAFRVQIGRMGEVHFIDSDVEILGEGVVVTRLNGPTAGRNQIWWDDSQLDQLNSQRRCSTTPVLVGNGVDSSAGVHGWDLGNCTSSNYAVAPDYPSADSVAGTWGNLNIIDRWSYVPIAKQYTLEVPAFSLAKEADPISGSSVKTGQDVNYKVTTAPIRYGHMGTTNADATDVWIPATSWSGRYTDNLTSVADNATIDWGSLTTAPSAANSAVRDSGADSYTWTGTAVPLATSVVTSYRATVKNASELGVQDLDLHNIAYAHGGVSPPAPPTECRPLLCGETTHPVVQPNLEVVKTANPESGQNVTAGQNIDYTITFKNTGTASAVVDYTDFLSRVLDDAILVSDQPVSSDAALTADKIVDEKFRVHGDLAAGASATVKYSVTVNADGARGDDVLDNFVVKQDPTTPAVPPVEPPVTTQCVEGQALCTTHPVDQPTTTTTEPTTTTPPVTTEPCVIPTTSSAVSSSAIATSEGTDTYTETTESARITEEATAPEMTVDPCTPTTTTPPVVTDPTTTVPPVTTTVPATSTGVVPPVVVVPPGTGQSTPAPTAVNPGESTPTMTNPGQSTPTMANPGQPKPTTAAPLGGTINSGGGAGESGVNATLLVAGGLVLMLGLGTGIVLLMRKHREEG